MDTTRIIDGDIFVDHRGTFWTVNDFHFEGVNRFYIRQAHSVGQIWAWKGHKHEAKYVYVSKGSAVVGAVKIDNWEAASHYCECERYVLSDKKPRVLYIPEGYANGFMPLEDDTLVVHFATGDVDKNQNDGRWPSDYFTDFQWKAKER